MTRCPFSTFVADQHLQLVLHLYIFRGYDKISSNQCFI
jgi:hypothetical protein